MRMTGRRRPALRLVGAAVALGLLVAACGDDTEETVDDTEETVDDPVDDTMEDEAEAEPDEAEDEEAAADDEGPPDLEPVGPVRIGSIAAPPIVAMIPVSIADELGLFEKYNVEVEIRQMETGVDAARGVQGGDLDLAWSPTGPVMTFAGTGVDVAALFGMDNIDWLVATLNPDIQECADLEGETIAVDSVGGARYSVLQTILAGCDLTIDDVDVISFPGIAATQAAVAGQIDTLVMHIETLYVIEEQADGREMQVVEWLIDANPLEHYLVFWTLRESIEDNREAYVRVLAAQIEAIRFMNDPDNIEQVVEIGQVTGYSEQVIRDSMPDFFELEFWPIDRDGLTQANVEEAIANQVLVENMEEEDAPDYDDVVDPSLYAEALELVERMN